MGKKANFIDIKLPKESADSYYMKEMQHSVDDFIYLDEEWYGQLFDPTTFYILGPKGSGKTLYAAYMCADIRNDTISKYHRVSVDDYGRIIEMKNAGHLNFTDYSTIWKVILLQKLLCSVNEKDIAFWGRAKSFQAIQGTILEHFGYDVTQDDFNPVKEIDSFEKQIEITNYLNSELNVNLSPVELVSGSAGIKGSVDESVMGNTTNKTERVTNKYIDTWLRSIDSFKRMIASVALKYDYYLFIDGLDVRPTQYSASEYGECIGALIRTIYELNTQVFGNIKFKNAHRFKIIALTRTDIFLNSNLVNVTSCINDNCVELDWTYSNEKDFLYSKLYKMMNRVLGWDGICPEMPVQRFFGFQISSSTPGRNLHAALHIQRLSRLRPRDIVVLFNLIQQECRARRCPNPDSIIINASSVVERYSHYYIDQVKSEMRFSYTSDEINHIFRLLGTIKHTRITEQDFKILYTQYCRKNVIFRNTFSSLRSLVDVLYSLDVIGWVEFYDGYQGVRTKTHWHYRETNAIDEKHRFPWERFDNAPPTPKFILHSGATKYILGT